jgi:cytoskeletal protein RodZ
MFRTSVRLVAALIVAVGLLVAPATGLSKSKPRKEAKVSKKKESSRDKKSKKSSKRDDRASKRKASSKAAAKSPAKSSTRRRGKNDDDDSRATRRRREQPRPVVARNVSDDDEDVEEAEEPAGPRPANRLVADIATTRVVQIQSALIQRGLLVGPPSGVYDQATFQAMSSFQARNGWNANGNPTADALKALGVPKNSGRSLYTPARVVEATAPPQ